MKKILNLFMAAVLLCLLCGCDGMPTAPAEPQNVTTTPAPTATKNIETPTPTVEAAVPEITKETEAPTKEPEQEAAITNAPTKVPTPTKAPTPTEAPKKTSFSVTYLDVGQGDAALIECDGKYMMIDGGEKDKSSFLYSYLKQREIKNLEIMVGTHAHSDHVGGLPGALNYVESVKYVLAPVQSADNKAFSDFAKYAGQKSSGITVPKVHDTYMLGSAKVEILGLNAGGEEVNDTSIVLSVEYKGKKFLFTGDAEREAEQKILADPDADLDSYVLKVGHHGSNSSTTYPFLREIMPEYAVICVGKGNDYGHPTDATLSRLRDAGVQILRTDLHGSITFTCKDETWSVTTEKSATQEQILTAGGKRVVTPVPTPIVDKDEDDTTDGKTTYVGNKNTKKFHYPGCKSVKQMKESNRVFFTETRDEIIAKGYKPCGNCNP